MNLVFNVFNIFFFVILLVNDETLLIFIIKFAMTITLINFLKS